MTLNQTQGTCFSLARIDSSQIPRSRRLRFGLLLCTAISPVGVFAQQLPLGGVVTAGSATISASEGSMVVNQSSNNAILNWQDFSIGAGNAVTFRQPDQTSTTLNRVNGSLPSQIDGSLSANGSVFLINPNGVIIGPGGTVRTGSFLASSLDVSDKDFLQGHFSFEGSGASASVENHGEITSLSGGFVALLGGSVKNSGSIAVPLGRVGFGAGERITLDFGGDGFLQVAVPSVSDADGALIEHSGTITADGGTVIMSAATARHAVRHAINLSGVVEARSVSGRNGHVRLGGGSGGTVEMSGRIDARAADLDLRGGEVVLTGAGLFVMPQAVIDASGGAGGGVVRIGGGWQGGEDLPWAYTTVLENGAEVRADGLRFGDGGSIALWSENATYFAGDISASGGPDGGNGGEVEVSSTGRLVLQGDVDLTAPQGDRGALLLDPIDIEVVADVTTDDVFIGAPDIDSFSVTFNPRVIFGTSFETPSTIEAAQLVEYLLGGDVTLQAADDGLEDSVEEGNITISAPLSWGTETTLLLDAVNDITINAPIDAAQGGLQFNTSGDITTGAAGTIDVDQFRLIRGNWRQIGETLPRFAANVFTSGDAEGDRSFLRALGGDGSAENPYLITDIYGLQGIDSDTLLDQHFALANSINASGTAGWVSTPGLPGTFQRIGRYFAATPVAGALASPFSGSIDGRGHTISNLTIDREGFDGVGFIALNEGTVRNLNFTNADITGWNSVGTVAGINDGTISNVSVDGNVSAIGGGVGGLAGQNFDEITSSSFDGTVFGSTGDIGGAVGFNGQDAVISQLSSSGAVNLDLALEDGALSDIHIGGLLGRNGGGGTPGLVEFGQSSASVSARVSEELNAAVPGIDTFVMNTGGLIGSNDGNVLSSRSTGNLSGDWGNIGGFVGTNDGTVVNSYSEASLRTGNPELRYERDLSVGGFAGWNNAAITQVFSSGDVLIGDVPNDDAAGTGVEVRIGGLLGTNQGDGRVTDAYTLSSLDVRYESPTSDVAVGGFAGANEGRIERGYAAAPIAGVDSASIDAFAGTQSGTVTGVFWDATLAGEFSSGMGFGLPSETFQETNSFIDQAVGWDFETVWAPPKPGTYPRQYPTSPVIYIVPEDVIADAGDDYEIAFAQFGGPDVYLFDDLDNAVSGITFTPSDAVEAGAYDIIAPDSVASGDDTTFDIVAASASLTLNSVDMSDEGISDQAPTFDPELAVATTPNATAVTFNVFSAVSDPDSDEFTIDGTPLDTPSGEVSIAPDGVVTFTPNEGVTGDVVLDFEVSDGTTAITVPFTVTVEAPIFDQEDPPVANIPEPDEDQERAITPPLVTVDLPPNQVDTITNLPNLALDTPSQDQGAVLGAVAVSPEAAEETEAVTRAVSSGYDLAVASCRQDEDIATVDSLACVSEALAKYASALEELEQEFSESLQGVSAIIREARVGVDDVIARAETRLAAATTDAERAAINAEALSEAQNVIEVAQARIREAVTLAKAGDPVIERLQAAQGGVVVAALETTNVELARATGL